MGTLNTKSLSKEQRDRLGVDASGRPKLAPALQAYVWFCIKGNPPTTTHQDKNIKFITSRTTGKRHATLLDSPALKAAREYYLLAIPERPLLIPLQPPVVGWFDWFFETEDVRLHGEYCTAKPDVDNLTKAAADALARRGYLIDDSHMAVANIEKRWVPLGLGRTSLYLRSLNGRFDAGPSVLRGDETPGQLYPVPWLTADDVAAFERAMRGSAVARAIGTPGGVRKPDWPKKGAGR